MEFCPRLKFHPIPLYFWDVGSSGCSEIFLKHRNLQLNKIESFGSYTSHQHKIFFHQKNDGFMFHIFESVQESSASFNPLCYYLHTKGLILPPFERHNLQVLHYYSTSGFFINSHFGSSFSEGSGRFAKHYLPNLFLIESSSNCTWPTRSSPVDDLSSILESFDSTRNKRSGEIFCA